MPTFQYFKGRVKVDELCGADDKALEEKIKKWIGDEEGESSGVKGHVRSSLFSLKTLLYPGIDRSKKNLDWCS